MRTDYYRLDGGVKHEVIALTEDDVRAALGAWLALDPKTLRLDGLSLPGGLVTVTGSLCRPYFPIEA